MKKNQIILIVVTLLFTGIIYFIVLYNKKEEIKETKGENTTKYVSVQVIQNQKRSLKTFSYGQILPYTELDVAFEIQGKLEKGAYDMKPGRKFKFNELLYKINSEEMYFTLSARKTQLANLLINVMADIELDYPNESEKWNEFLEKISPAGFLPQFPQFQSDKEKKFITAKGIYTEFLNIKSLEARMTKYLFMAPFNGFVVDIYAEPGSIINPGTRIAKIANADHMEVKIPIPLDLFEKFKEKGSVKFLNSENEAIGTGSILRVTNLVNQNTQSIDVYYSIKPFKNTSIISGQHLTAEIDNLISESMCAIPSTAVKKNQVFILKNAQFEKKSVKILGSKQDSLFVDGLNDSDTLILEYNEPNKKIKKYIGIERQ